MSAFPKMLLTNVGIALQAKVQSGVTLELTRIGLGDGNLNGQPISPLKNLINQTASVPINDKEIIKSNTLQVSGFFSNQDIQKGFYWREFGVFANDPDSGEILYAYSNAGNAGDYIPTIADQRIEKYIYASFAVENAENVNITIPQSDTFIPKKDKGAENGVASLDETGKIPQDQLPELDFIPNDEKGHPNGVAPLNKDKVLEIEYGGTGANNVQEAIYNLGCIPRENLLDNAYFIGGGDFGKFPVNQKGKKIYTNDDTWHNSIDRWRYATTATLNILDDCLQISDTNTRNDPSFSQFKSQSFKAGRYTISALCKCSNKVNDNVFLNLWTGKKWATENFEFQYNYKVSDEIDLIFVTVDIDEDTVPNDCYCTLFAMGNTIDLYAMKLEEGDFQTLAWKDNREKWHLFETPDYASVFRDCLRYYVEFRKMEGPINEFKNNNLWSGHCQAISTDELLVNYQFPVPMRTIPAISVYAKGDGEEMVTINKVRDSSTGASVDISGFTCSYVTNFGFAIIRKQGAFVQSRFYDFIIVANAEL